MREVLEITTSEERDCRQHKERTDVLLRSQSSPASPRWLMHHLLIRSLCLWQTSTSLFLYHHPSAKAGGNEMPPILAKLEVP